MLLKYFYTGNTLGSKAISRKCQLSRLEKQCEKGTKQ